MRQYIHDLIPCNIDIVQFNILRFYRNIEYFANPNMYARLLLFNPDVLQHPDLFTNVNWQMTETAQCILVSIIK